MDRPYILIYVISRRVIMSRLNDLDASNVVGGVGNTDGISNYSLQKYKKRVVMIGWDKVERAIIIYHWPNWKIVDPRVKGMLGIVELREDGEWPGRGHGRWQRGRNRQTGTEMSRAGQQARREGGRTGGPASRQDIYRDVLTTWLIETWALYI